ncbi:MAG: glycoside hydrolase family 99-like domain-containing protein [bacterium]
MNTHVRAIAFYLPQFHPIPENDRWWGRGFTEWSNVVKAKPLFEGHYQPHLPADLGFYDLRVPEVREQQAELARDAGIEGFCYWHYWFGSGKRALERVFNEVVQSGQPDFPFCLAWANESWTGRWHGLDDQVIFEQTYPGLDDWRNHFMALLPAFWDRRYVEVDGRKLFILYRPAWIPDLAGFVNYWNGLAHEHGFKGFYFVSGDLNSSGRPFEELDGVFLRSIGNAMHECRTPIPSLRWNYRARRLIARIVLRRKIPPVKMPLCCPYEAFVKKYGAWELGDKMFPCAVPNWDNTPRCGVRGEVLIGATPELFASLVRTQVQKLASRPLEHRLLFIKSWNEWAEGNYVEPDAQFGKGCLEALKRELKQND